MDFILDKQVKAWLNECKQIINSKSKFKVDFKSSFRDIVTEVDKEIEGFLRSKILENFPDHRILGEESVDERGVEGLNESKNLWVIDPLDGTSNFVKQGRDYCTMLAYFEKGKAKFSYIYDYTNDEIISAFDGLGVYINDLRLERPRDSSISESPVATDSSALRAKDYFHKLADGAYCLRSVGASGLDGTRVAKGMFGAYVNLSAALWDYGPFILIAKELDLKISKIDGTSLDLGEDRGYIIGTPKAHEEIVEIFRP